MGGGLVISGVGIQLEVWSACCMFCVERLLLTLFIQVLGPVPPPFPMLSHGV